MNNCLRGGVKGHRGARWGKCRQGGYGREVRGNNGVRGVIGDRGSVDTGG